MTSHQFPKKLACTLTSALIVWSGATAFAAEPPGRDALDAYDVIWPEPSLNVAGSMPVGNGDLGINVWAEADGSLQFLAGKTDTWDEHGRLLKLGKVRIDVTPNPFAKGLPFEQRTVLRDGVILVKAGEKGAEVRFRIWVDANHPSARFEMTSDQPVGVKVTLENWRKEVRELSGPELEGVDSFAPGEKAHVYPDTILARPDELVWYHRNIKSIWPVSLKLQSLEALISQQQDPLQNRTFGASLTAPGLRAVNSTTLESARPINETTITLHALTKASDEGETWPTDMARVVSENGLTASDAQRQAHAGWWRKFWDRSYLRITGNDELYVISRHWYLQRWVTAGTGRGEFPIKFNGTIFNIDGSHDPKGEKGPHDADYRQWGPAYWWQNTRHAYWNLAAAGDWEMMKPLFRMYLNALPLAKHRTKVYFGHEGAFFPETTTFWGTYVNDGGLGYGWDRTGKPPGLTDNQYIRNYRVGGLELVALMLEYFDHTLDPKFAADTLVPMADAVLEFYANHYQRDAARKIRMEPAQMLETWWDVVNPTPDIAGLHFVTSRLLDLPDGSGVTSTQRERWDKLRAELPPIARTTRNDKAVIAMADEIRQPDVKHNNENGNFYAIFPFRQFGVGRLELPLAQDTFLNKWFVNYYCVWDYDPLVAAYVGLPEEASKKLFWRVTYPAKRYRFPAMFDGDWANDIQNGSLAQSTTQAMLIQNVDDKIYVLPAWPKDWNVEFKLWASNHTTVECVYRNGIVEKLDVQPASRRADVRFGTGVLLGPEAKGVGHD